MMKTEAQQEHEWLQQLVGEWIYEHECSMEPGKPPEKFQGSAHVRALGDLWVLCESQGEMPGGGLATMVITLGYDPQKRRYVGTWIGSVMTHLWIYDGALDANGKTLTLATEGPSCTGDGTFAKYQDVIEIKDRDHRVLTSHMQSDDGEWQQFMTAKYRRKK